MKEIFLAVIFMINGQTAMIDGWHPRQHPDMESCNIKKEFMEHYVVTTKGLPEVGEIYCGTQEQIQHQIRILNSESA